MNPDAHQVPTPKPKSKSELSVPTPHCAFTVHAAQTAERIASAPSLIDDDDETVTQRPSVKLLAAARGDDELVEAADVAVDIMRNLYANGDTEGALAIATLLTVDEHATNRETVAEFDEAVDPFGGLILVEDAIPIEEADFEMQWDWKAVPIMVRLSGTPPNALGAVNVEAAPLLAHVDGVNTLSEILAACGMPEVEALALFAMLVERGVIELA